MIRCCLALLLAAVMLGGPASAEPLTGRVWMPGEDRFADTAEVEQAVAGARYVLLGEEHPIARHHALQARLIQAAARGRRPAVVFEMIPVSRQRAIGAWRETPQPDAAALGPAVAWGERGWPDWQLYAPIARTALAHDLPLLGGGPAPEEMRTVARAGFEGLARERSRALGLDQPLPDEGRARLLETLRTVHCGELHAPAERMLAIQRLRDASMAERLRGAGPAGAVLIAGHGHAREDYGVPQYLGAQPTELVTVAFRATGGLGDRIADHVSAAGGKLPYDFVWFTEGRAVDNGCGATDD